jgi:uncharacterized protein (DUF433 family)
MTARALSEAEKMQMVPGIVFADEVLGRVPRIAGTGLQVFEIIKVYQAENKDFDLLSETFHWLSPQQLNAALAYYAAFPEEVDARIALEDEDSEDC